MPIFNNVIGNVGGAILGCLTNGYVFGYIMSFFVNSYVVDNLGRKMGIQIGNLIVVIGVIIQSCAGVWIHNLPDNNTDRDVLGMLIGARFVIGFGTGLISVAGPCLVSELSYPTHKSATTAAYNSSWYLGAIVASWVSYGTKGISSNWSWRIPTILQGFFPVLQSLLLPFFVSESPRYLVAKGKVEEGKAILSKWHGGDLKESEMLVDYELTEIQLALEQERIQHEESSYKDFIKTAANRKRLWIFCWLSVFMQLSGNGLVSYYLSKVLTSIGITSTSEQLVVNAGLTIYNWGCSLIQSLFIVPRIKRRHAFNCSLFGMLICFIIWTILSAVNQERDFKDKSLGKGVLAMIFLYYFCYNFGLNGMPYMYLTEILPFTLRGKGINLFSFIGCFFSIYNGFVNSIAMDAIEWKYYIVYCCILGVECCVEYFTFVETSGYTLEEVAEVFGDASEIRKASGMAVMEEEKLKASREHTEYA
ncbi:hypothetical protein FOA43_002377 [Brettanomyces nanus]|uniref:Major facilitator superfamily (MFS) profile domain-containing protein n=1 Tax=Eeniella nana TaxID=13502 RepID=A0A875RUX4_EENNA|nr:uncharacterized protein FOA43_002377 [Brettanomyces nanus]QPG75037.1 hypothetical protein FOA43_002377 [Brettanomyces nanus]